jgi:hypothetical protein
VKKLLSRVFLLLPFIFIAYVAAATLFEPVLDTPFKNAPRPIIGALRESLENLPQIENFEVVGYNPLPNPGDTIARGRNGPIAISGNCLYVGNRIGRRTGTTGLPPEVLIVDISRPNDPQVVSSFTTVPGATSREMRAIPDRNTLIIMHFQDGAFTPGTNNFQIYDISNCQQPVLRQTLDLAADTPHEFFVWRDPDNTSRYLLYTSVNSIEPSLRVYEVNNPPTGTAVNVPVATFSLAPAVAETEPTDPNRYRDDHFVFQPKPTSQTNRLHSMAVSEDGTRVYMANSQAGYYILDSSRLAARLSCVRDTVTVDETSNLDPNLCLRKINPDPQSRIDLTPPYGGIHHSIYPIPGGPYLWTGGERNGTTTCPWTGGQILDASDEMNLQIVAHYMVPENLSENCFIGGPGDPSLLREFSTHQPLLFKNIVFLTWYSAGLRAWDVSNPRLPLEVGVFVPRPAAQVVERFRNSPDVWMWPFPILHNGLIYVTDENSGLYVLRYTGRRAKELPQRGTFLSNTNIR